MATTKSISPTTTKARTPGRTGTAKPVKQATSKTTAPAVVESEEESRPKRPLLHTMEAAERAVGRDTVRVVLPVLGELHLPATDELVFLGGVGLLAVVGVLEWPVAVLLGLGHGLATGHRNKTLRAFGEALEEV